ncbi:MAG: hypothetical protein ACI9ZH_001318 [Paracoccaceae bacterium]|jgi:hypothetical protein
MKKSDRANLRIKRRHLIWLKEAKGLSDAAVDRAAASIDRYDAMPAGQISGGFMPRRPGCSRSTWRRRRTREPASRSPPARWTARCAI